MRLGFWDRVSYSVFTSIKVYIYMVRIRVGLE